MNNIAIIITGILGATLTFYVSENLKQGPIRASALLSLIVGSFFFSFPEILNPYLSKNLQIVFIGTTFIGMVSSEAKGSYFRLALAGSLFSIIYINKSNFFEGYGGALGALALIALLTTMGFSVILLKSTKIKRGMVIVRKKVLPRKSKPSQK
ncbi:hypothetical protein [Arcticibacterium luteifluviistationis]|uniref:Uncharacterized protein n=1 Tax=Arcticibacterium luteifluviistationis TaxID=1784714 RepID=A0A2Z4G7M4_9BACT|nr:hypothetical protein [Arcticibacterium luteifluviistationis]AWV97100.1 hypothetical protein DJ013_02480 [Arcticibacterium luteifluviistationis]